MRRTTSATPVRRASSATAPRTTSRRLPRSSSSSAAPTRRTAGRGGLLAECLIDGNGRDGVSIGNTHGAYTVRANRISHNGRFGYYQHNIRNDPRPGREIVIEANEIWKNGLDGIRIEAPMLDASITGNRVRNNGRRVAPAASNRGAGVTYASSALKDAGARWQPDGHKGKTVLVAGMTALVASNSERELQLFPSRPGQTSAWENGVPQDGTPYRIQEEAPPVRPGIGIAAHLKGAWIRGNRIWDNQERRTQGEDIFVAGGGRCDGCRIDDTD
jgi:hypothetical protein